MEKNVPEKHGNTAERIKLKNLLYLKAVKRKFLFNNGGFALLFERQNDHVLHYFKHYNGVSSLKMKEPRGMVSI